MQNNNNVCFYHLSRWKLDLNQIGKIFTTPEDESNYWKGKLQLEWANNFISASIFKNIYIGELPLSKFICHGKYASELLKEYVFEEVRMREFPTLPSRRRCMFLFPQNLDPWEYAEHLNFKTDQHILLTVRPLSNARVHITDMMYLNCNLSDHSGMTEAARKYWQPVHSGNLSSEVLLEGKWELVRLEPLKKNRNS